jgi:ribosomal protein S6--L-glutamate ligase
LIARDYQAIIVRLAGAGFDFGLGNLRHLNRNLNIFATGTDAGLRICSNKFLTVQALSENGIRVPRHVLAHRPSDYKELIDLAGGLPCVAKLQRGSQGSGIFILNDILSASTSLRAMEQTNVDIVLTRFINSGNPANDIRIITIGAETKTRKFLHTSVLPLTPISEAITAISKRGEKVKIT